MTTLTLNLGENSYDIHIGGGLMSVAGEFFSLGRKVLVVTDSGVPAGYAKAVAEQCREAHTVTVKQGEGSKTVPVFENLCREMMKHGFTRKDCVVAVGGGVVGDLAGFAAASYMRGIDFYNIPTTVLSSVDSSIGGKTGVNLDGIKNIIGAFCQPKGVIVDPALTKTLPARQVSNGLAEAVKMALTFDPDLFALFENGDPAKDLEKIIVRSLRLKADVVGKDEKEAGLRRVLNFGHTIGHGIESLGLGYYHGECVALGMLPMCSPEVRARLIPVLEKLNLPVSAQFDRKRALEAILHDKKSGGGCISAVFVDKIGSFRIENITPARIAELLDGALK